MFRNALFVLTLVTTLGLAAQAADKPNIVLILADDMGFDSVSVNNADDMGPLSTPHIDRLAKQGMNFVDAHSGSSVCTPTRYGLLTGRYCWRTALKKEVLWDYGRPLIEDERLTVAELLKQQGYTTGMVGKWHLGFDWYDQAGELANADIKIADATWRKGGGSADRIRACIEKVDYTKRLTGGPTDHGFDYYWGVDVPNFSPYAWISQDQLTAQPTSVKPNDMFGTDGPMVPGWKLEEILPTLAKRSAEWITKQSKTDEPFFLYLPLTSPHTPIAPSGPFQGKSVNKYADFIVETDWVVGHVLKAIDNAGVADDTLVIFTADNGTAAASGFAALKSKGVDLKVHLRAHKGSIYDGGHRVPFIARWPSNIRAGATCREVVCLNDFMATVADILDASLPNDAAEDSTSILPLLTGEAIELQNRRAVVHHSYNGSFAIREGKWKLVFGDQLELYDMQADRKESNNVAAENTATVTALTELLEQFESTGRSRP